MKGLTCGNCGCLRRVHGFAAKECEARCRNCKTTCAKMVSTTMVLSNGDVEEWETIL